MLCPNCENENRDGAKFCDECGFPLTGAIARAAIGSISDVHENADSEESTPEEAPAPQEEPPSDEPSPEAADDGAEQAPEVIAPIEDAEAGEGEPQAEGAAEAEELGENAEEPLDAGATMEIDADAIGEEGAPAAVGAADMTAAIAPDITVAIGAELSGLDVNGEQYGERLVDSDYLQPQANWRDGNTIQMPRVETEEAPKSKDFLASSTTEQKRSKKVLVGIIAGIIAIAAIVAFATYQMELWGGKAVPDVSGMTEADASTVLEESGFTVRTTQVKSDDTEGLVLIMDPTAGSRAEEGSEVVIHIATARSIPNVVGKTKEEAEAAFEEEGYENVTYATERSDAAEGTVLSVSPEAGTRAKSTLAVIVKVAEPYMVPDTTSMGLDATIQAIQNAGLRYDISYVDTEAYPDGSVIGTDPAAGSKVTSDTVVVISIARARAAQLTQLTRNMLSPGSTVTIDGISYDIESLDSVEYVGNDTVAFTFTGSPFTYFMGQYVSLDSRQVSGHVTWTSDNGVSSIE